MFSASGCCRNSLKLDKEEIFDFGEFTFNFRLTLHLHPPFDAWQCNFKIRSQTHFTPQRNRKKLYVVFFAFNFLMSFHVRSQLVCFQQLVLLLAFGDSCEFHIRLLQYWIFCEPDLMCVGMKHKERRRIMKTEMAFQPANYLSEAFIHHQKEAILIVCLAWNARSLILRRRFLDFA